MIAFESAKNPIYNILTAYAEFDKDIGYTQGMNFLVALLYAAVQDEIIAFGLLSKLMFEQSWRLVYSDDLIQVLTITKKVQSWLEKEHPKIAQKLNEAGVVLEVQLSSPVMGLFANMVSLDVALRVLDRFILHGEAGVLSIVKKAFTAQKKVILGIKDPFEL